MILFVATVTVSSVAECNCLPVCLCWLVLFIVTPANYVIVTKITFPLVCLLTPLIQLSVCKERERENALLNAVKIFMMTILAMSIIMN